MNENNITSDDERKPLREENRNVFLFSFKEAVFIIALLLLGIGIEYCFDVPGALQISMMEYYNLSYYQYSLLYSLYSLPNIFHSLIGGFLIDRVFGLKIGTIIYLSIALFGMVLYSFGAITKHFSVMLLGRLVYGIGAEMGGTVCMNIYIYNWFKDSYVNLVYSLNDNMGYVGTLLAYSTSQSIYGFFHEYYSGKKTLDFTLVATSASFVIAYVGGLIAAVLKPPVKNTSRTGSENGSSLDVKDGNVRISDCMSFPLQFWLLCVLYGCYSNGVYSIQDFQQDFLVKEFTMTIDKANTIINGLTILQVVISIPFSIAVDKIGKNIYIVTASIVITIISHVLVCIKVTPYISLGLLGLGYAMMASTIWPMYAYPLQKKYHGLGYGIASCFQSLSLTVSPMIAGHIIDAKGYFAAEYFYFATLAVSLIAIIIINILDRRSTRVLNMSAQERKELLIQD